MKYNLQTNIDDAKNEFRAWHKTDKSQTDKLYEILAKTLEIVENIKTDYDKNSINTQLKKYKITVKQKTSFELRVTRLIMTKRSKKAAVYAKVITVARQEGIGSADFIVWLKKKGGIEKVRNSVSIAKQQAKRSMQFDAGKKRALAKSKLATLKYSVKNTKQDDLILLVGRVDSNNDVEIIDIAGIGENSDLVEKAVRDIT